MSLQQRVLGALGQLGRRAPRLASAALSVRESVKHRSVRRVFRDADGDWVYVAGGRALASPFLTLEPPEDHVARAEHHWVACQRPPPGGTVIDVGAGLGEDALLFSSWVGPGGRVISIEADPAIFRCLVKTVTRSRAQAVLPLNIAVGASEGVTRINSDPQFLARRTDAQEGTEVRLKTLDGLASELNIARLDLLKMNIEGAEIAALEGAPQLLRRTRAVVVSCHDFLANRFGHESMRTRARVQELLRASGFQLPPPVDRGADWLNDIVVATRPDVTS